MTSASVTPRNLRDLVKDYGLSTAQAADLIEVNHRTFRRWLADGGPPIPSAAYHWLIHRLESLPEMENGK